MAKQKNQPTEATNNVEAAPVAAPVETTATPETQPQPEPIADPVPDPVAETPELVLPVAAPDATPCPEAEVPHEEIIMEVAYIQVSVAQKLAELTHRIIQQNGGMVKLPGGSQRHTVHFDATSFDALQELLALTKQITTNLI